MHGQRKFLKTKNCSIERWILVKSRIMKIESQKAKLSGAIRVPGSKSHTIRALLFSSLAEGTSHIRNPLGGADCISSSKAVPLFGAKVDISNPNDWIVVGAGKNAHLPDDVVNVGNSGSLLYFMSPVAATFEGWTVFTGDESIRTRPVLHVADALKQLGAEAYISRPGKNAPPLIIKGPIKENQTIVTDGRLSQYISGIMMAASRINGTTHIELTDPKETPFLNMTRLWLEEMGVKLEISGDYKHIQVHGPVQMKAFDKEIPSDWEAVAFPLVAALISPESEITINNIDFSGSQGDMAIVDVLKQLGADIIENKEKNTITAKYSRLSTEKLPGGELHVNLSGYPDAICALAVAGCFTEGTIVIEDIGVCRKKETDRIEVMQRELKKLGAKIETGSDWLKITGHSPLNPDGTKNSAWKIHGGNVESYDDHRVAMSLAVLGLGLDSDETVTINNAECCAVSFPDFYNKMNTINAGFREL